MSRVWVSDALPFDTLEWLQRSLKEKRVGVRNAVVEFSVGGLATVKLDLLVRPRPRRLVKRKARRR